MKPEILNRSALPAFTLIGLFVLLPQPVWAQTDTPRLPGLDDVFAGSTPPLIVRSSDIEDMLAKYNADMARHDELYRRGSKMFEEGKLEEAEKLIKEASNVNPDFLPDTVILPRIYIKQERWSEIISIYGQFERRNATYGGSPCFILPYALALAKVGSVQQAIKVYYSCLKDVNAPHYLRLHLLFDGDPATVRRSHLVAAIEVAFGMADYNGDRSKSAIAHYRSALSVYPNMSLIHYYLGNALCSSKDKSEREEGRAFLERAAQSGSPTTAGVARRALKVRGLLR